MLANAELAQDYSILNRQYQQLVSALLEAVGLQGIPFEVAVTEQGNFRGFDAVSYTHLTLPTTPY